jgi:hypothetical protein
VQDRKERERETAVKKAAAQDAKEAKQAERQLQNNLKQAKKWKKGRDDHILATEQVDLEVIDDTEAQVAESASRRPWRQKRLPHKFDGCEI